MAIAVAGKGLRKTYHLGEPVHALDGVDISLEDGSYTAVMGPSGSGKSTLMNVLGCLDTPDAGTLTVDGREVQDLSENARARLRSESIGFVFQTFNLMPRLTALENVALPTQFTDGNAREGRERAAALLERVGLADRAHHRPTELSGGQRQRVAIARALVNDPTIILADEPTGNLDSTTSASIMALFEELHDEGRTIVTVTHEPDIAAHAERTIHMLDGGIERIDPAREIPA